jgi:ubiquinone/menaquinone biosynthesis C-methylase UbiE
MLSLTASQVMGAINRMMPRSQSAPTESRHNCGPLQVIDVACGGGDVTVALARRLGRRLPAVHVTGLDISSRAVARAERHSRRKPGGATVSFAVHDILAKECPPCDVATVSLFLHHLDDDDAVRVLVSVARVDGPLSVRAARTPAEYRMLLDRAGLREATIHRAWPQRAILVWTRSGDQPTPSAAQGTA